jgi:hypothetical protein
MDPQANHQRVNRKTHAGPIIAQTLSDLFVRLSSIRCRGARRPLAKPTYRFAAVTAPVPCERLTGLCRREPYDEKLSEKKNLARRFATVLRQTSSYQGGSARYLARSSVRLIQAVSQ